VAEFRARVLGILDRIYRFTAAKTYTDQLDLSSPIQLVHDVHREAELGTGIGIYDGFVNLGSWGVNHPGGNTQRYVIDPYVSILAGASPVDPVKQYVADDIDAWLMSFQVISDTSNQPATAFRFGWIVDDMSPYATESMPVYFFEGNGTTANATNYAGTGTIALLQKEPCDTAVPYITPLPFLFPHTGRVSIASVSTAACNVFVHALLWVGARGTSPPGVP